MSIALIVTRGYGNGTLTGSIADVVTRGYTIGEVAPEFEISARFDIFFTSEDREIYIPAGDREIII